MSNGKPTGNAIGKPAGKPPGTSGGAQVVAFPARVAPAEADQDVASVIAVLQDQLALAREGRLRSVAVVSVSADGEAVGTHWSCTGADITGLIGKLTVLTHDMMAARK